MVAFPLCSAPVSVDGMKPIEEIRKGDWVWSVAPETGDPELKQVEDVFVNETDEIVHVRYGDTEIDATPTHPFYTPDRGWVSAVNLRAGDRLQLVNGEYVTVEQVQHEILESPVKVYNFEVQDNHTYYVGGDDDDSAVLVHNKCPVTENHHMFTNINKKYKPQFNKILGKYHLSTSGKWNIWPVAKHRGRHTDMYHEFMLQQLKAIDVVAAGDINKFQKHFNNLAQYVTNHPEVLYKKK